jgi:hypothetical protein
MFATAIVIFVLAAAVVVIIALAAAIFVAVAIFGDDSERGTSCGPDGGTGEYVTPRQCTDNRAAGSADLYLAAFFGAGGAIKFLGAMATNPGTAAASLLPAAAAANRSVFFHKDGSARTLRQVHDLVAGRINRHLGGGGNPLPPTGRISPPADPALTASRAQMAYLVLAAMQ